MIRTRVHIDPQEYPQQFHTLLGKAQVYDSSCSTAAKVWFLDLEDGYYLKTAKSGYLEREMAMTEYFHSKGMAAEVLCFLQENGDWLLTRRIPGEDCLHQQYTHDPKRLCDTTAELLRRLHETDLSGCPVNRRDDYLKRTFDNYHNHIWDESLFPDNWGYRTAEEAWTVVQQAAPILKQDTLLHGDYCLPNIMLNDWNFSGFIDLECAGAGDRHIDLFWGIWSLQFNLGTNRWKERFLDAYGRDVIDLDILGAIGAFEVFG